jgi:hypothetical protein
MVVTTAAVVVSIRRRAVTALASGVCVIVLLSLVLLESFTGYLPRDDRGAQPDAEETHNRFYVLHVLTLPGLAITAAIAGGLMLRRANLE